MDPMTQSAQISSSQGFDGQNAAAAESKVSDKRVVLGSDKPSEGVATSLRFPSQPGSFSPGNYGGEAGPPDGQPDSPIKTSPVSERIKALEALAAKKKEPDFRNDSGFSHYRDRHVEKSPADKITSAPQKKVGSAVNSESPESPFEVLGDLGQINEFENTADWMRAHLPPVPDFDDAVDLHKEDQASGNIVKPIDEKDVPDVPAAFISIPAPFSESEFEDAKLKTTFEEPLKQPSAEEESEFDLSFLPTAYMWDQQENAGIQELPNLDPALPASPAPPATFGPTPPPFSPPVVTDAKHGELDASKTPYDEDMDPIEALEVDSSGESDDTVIEDGASAPMPCTTASSVPETPNASTPTPAPSEPAHAVDEKETPPLRTERRLMQVPTISVIEADEPNYSEEELEEENEQRYESVKDPAQDSANAPEPQPETSKPELNTRPLETEFMEGYSPPSSPVDSDVEYSPKHKIPRSEPDTVSQEPTIKTYGLQKTEESNESQVQPEKSQINSSGDKNPSPMDTTKSFTKEVDFSDNDDEWSDERQDILIKPDKTDINTEALPKILDVVDEKIDTDAKQGHVETLAPSKPSFIQYDLYERQSFEDDYDALPTLDETLDKNDHSHAQEPCSSDTSQIHIEVLCENTTYEVPKDATLSEDIILLDDDDNDDDEPLPKPVGGQPSPREYPNDPYSSLCELPSNSKEPIQYTPPTNDTIKENTDSTPQEHIDSKTHTDTPDTTSDPESIEPDCSVSQATDSFVDFMKECLKSRQDSEPEDAHRGVAANEDQPGTDEHTRLSPPTMVMDFEQEQLTIRALKELGSSQEEEDDVHKEETPFKPDCKVKPLQSPRFPTSNPLSPQANRTSDSKYSKEVEAIDEWVAEVCYLAEHVLTAILTHLSVKDLIHWRDPKKSGVVFGVSMLVLLSLAAFSVISVVSYLLLALLCVTITFRIYKSVVQAVQKSTDGHPFKCLMDKDVSIPPETFRKHVDASLTYINRALKQMSRLFLVEDLVDSLKLAVAMWLLTYVGAVFNGITILILADILLFAVPPIYEKNKTQIDQYIDVAHTQINSTMAKLQEKLPGAMKRSKSE